VYASTEIAYFGYIEGRQDQVSHHAFGSIPHHGVALLGYGEMCIYPAFNTLLQTCLQLCVSQGLGEHNSALCSLRELDVNPSREHLEAQCEWRCISQLVELKKHFLQLILPLLSIVLFLRFVFLLQPTHPHHQALYFPTPRIGMS
jgi:hypothetical protein